MDRVVNIEYLCSKYLCSKRVTGLHGHCALLLFESRVSNFRFSPLIEQETVMSPRRTTISVKAATLMLIDYLIQPHFYHGLHSMNLFDSIIILLISSQLSMNAMTLCL